MPIKLGSIVGQIVLDASGVVKGVNDANKAINGIPGQFANVGRELTTKISLPLIGIGTLAAKTAGDFQQEMAKTAIAARSSGTAMEDLQEAALQAGSDTRLLGVDAAEAAEAMTGFYKTGLTTADIFGDLDGYLADTTSLTGALRASVDLAAASDLELAGASDAVAISMKTFGLQAEDATNIADSFVKAADASVAEVSELVEAMTNVGPTAAAFGWSLDEMNTALAILSERGIRGAEAGTALKSMMTNLMRPTDDVTETLKELNVSLYDADGTMRSLPDIIGDMERAMSGMTEEQRNLAVQTLAGTYGMKSLQTLLTEGRSGWDEMRKAMERASTAQQVAQQLTNTFKGDLEKLEGSFQTFMIKAGIPFIEEFVGPAVQRLTELLDKMSEADQGTLKLGVSVGLIAVAAGPTIVALGSVVTGAGALIRVGSGVVTAISTLPTVLSSAAYGLQLLAQGESIAAISSLGLQAALGPLALALAAVAAVAGVAYVGFQRYKQVQEETAKVADTWTQFLNDQVAEGKSATEVAEAYAKAQARVNAELENAPGIVRLFINEERVMNADAATLSRTLADTADSYEEYLKACERTGLVQRDTNGELVAGEQVMSRWDFVTRNAAEQTNELERAQRKLGTAVDDGLDYMENWQRAVDEAASAYDPLVTSIQKVVEAYSDLEVQGSDFFRDWEKTQEAQRQAETEAIEEHQEQLLTLEEEYAQKKAEILLKGASAQTAANRQGSEERIAELQRDLERELQKQAEYTDKTKESTRMANAERVADLQAEIAQEQALIDGRGQAAAAAYARNTQVQLAELDTWYSEQKGLEETAHSERMAQLAEQQAAEREQAKRHLGELLLQRVQYWIEAGKINDEEGAKLINFIMEQYGIVDAESLAAFKSATTAIDQFATGSQTSLEVVFGGLDKTATQFETTGETAKLSLAEAKVAIQEMGLVAAQEGDTVSTSTDTMANKYDENTQRIRDALFGTAKDAGWSFMTVRTETDQTAKTTEELAERSQVALPASASAIGLYATEAEEGFGRVITIADNTKKAIDNLPTSKTIDIRVNYDAPEEMQLQSPTFAFQHALESAVRFAQDNPIQVAAEMGAALRPAPVGTPAAMAGPLAGGAQGGESIAIPENLVHIDRVGDPIDVYQLAYQVADIIRRRGR